MVPWRPKRNQFTIHSGGGWRGAGKHTGGVRKRILQRKRRGGEKNRRTELEVRLTEAKRARGNLDPKSSGKGPGGNKKIGKNGVRSRGQYFKGQGALGKAHAWGAKNGKAGNDTVDPPS